MEIDRELASQYPDSATAQRDVGLDWQNLGRVIMARNDFARAESDFVAAINIFAKIVRADPVDKRTEYLLALAHEYAGLALLKSKNYETALTHYRTALKICRCRSQWEGQNAPPTRLAGIVYKAMGDSYSGLADQPGLYQTQRQQWIRSACLNYEQSIAAFDHLQSVGSFSRWDENTRAEAAAHSRQCPTPN